MQISVVIPTLGTRPAYLDEAVGSVLAQSLLPFEIIIVNNGASSLTLGEKLISNSVPIRIVQTVYRAGVAQARNIGATLAEGDLVAFLDDDDLWHKSYLENSINELKSKGARCVLGRIDKLVDGVTYEFLNASNYLDEYSFLVMNPGATGSNVLIYKSTFLEAGGYDPRLSVAEDGALIISLLDLGAKIAVSSDSQTLMRIHSGERLTDPRSSAEGFKAFYLKYGDRLGRRDRVYSIWKYRREEFRTKRSFWTFTAFVFYSFLTLACNRRPRSYWKHPESPLSEVLQ